MSDLLPEDAAERKRYPLYRGLFQYFPRALAAVALQSQIGGEQHGHAELHWDRNKSNDDEDAMLRHALEGDWAGAAWRALAVLEKAEEAKTQSESDSTQIESVCTQKDAEWIEWNGGECPVPDGTEVHIKYRYGGGNITFRPKDYRWSHAGSDVDIIAYKVMA